MPVTTPAGAQGGRAGYAPIVLVDVELQDNATRYYWADRGGLYPMKLGAGGNQQYQPFVKSFGPYKLTRTLQTDGGTVVIQDLSGNSIERDVSKAFVAAEFVGALCVIRLWDQRLAVARRELHCKLSKPVVTDVDLTFSPVALFDPTAYDALRMYQATCIWRYLSPACGSASPLATCQLDFGSCNTRGAVERFSGVPFAIPLPPAARDFGADRGGSKNTAGRFGIVQIE